MACLAERDFETSTMRWPWLIWGRQAMQKQVKW